MKKVIILYLKLKKLFFYILDFIIIKITKNPKIIRKNIIILRLDNIGDFILWIESAREIKNFYPKNKIIFICSSTIYSLAKSTKIFDQVISIDTSKFEKNIFYRIKNIILVKKLNSKIAINPIYSRVFLREDSLIRASDAQYRIGYNCDLSNITKFEKSISDCWYTKLICISNNNLHELEKNSEFNFNLGFKKNKKIKLANLNFIKVKKLKKKDLSKNKYMVVCPGSSVIFKRWSIFNFAFIANALKLKYKIGVVILGSKNEKELSENLFNKINGIEKYDLTGQTNLQEYIYLIKNAKLLLGNDSSAIHIAAATNTQSICILDWINAPKGRFLPYPKNLNSKTPICFFRKNNNNINPEKVLKYCINNLDQNFNE